MWRLTTNKDFKALLFVAKLGILRWSDSLLVASFHGVIAYNDLYSEWNPS